MQGAKIELIFVCFQIKPNVFYYQLSFQNEKIKIEDSKNDPIPIPDSIFLYNKYKNVISIELFDENLRSINQAKFHVYNDLNCAYIFRGEKGTNVEIIFRNIK